MNASVYSPLSDLAIMALRIKGTPLRVIAAALGISDTTVGTRIRALRRAGLSLEGAARLAQADAPGLDEVCARISSVPTTKRVLQIRSAGRRPPSQAERGGHAPLPRRLREALQQQPRGAPHLLPLPAAPGARHPFHP